MVGTLLLACSVDEIRKSLHLEGFGNDQHPKPQATQGVRDAM
jgi:hypothetical protein